MDALTYSDPAGLLGLAARATLVLGAALVLSRALRRSAAATRHVLWTATFVLLLALPIAAAWLPAWELPLLPASTGTGTSRAESAALVATGAGLGRSGDRVAVVPAEPAGALVRRSTGDPAGGSGPIPLAVLVWAIGSAAALASLTVGTLRFRSLVRNSIPVADPVWLGQLARLRLRLGIDARVRLLLSSDAHTPMTGGWRRPVVVLPASATTWTPERREVVLLHELVHVRRHDALRQLLGRATLALYWFHPLSWLASRQAGVTREQACDEAVLALGTRPSEYAAHLLALAEGMHAGPALASLPMIQPSQLEKRIMSILAPDRPRASAVATGAVLFLIGGLGLSAAIAHPIETRATGDVAIAVPGTAAAGRGLARGMAPSPEVPALAAGARGAATSAVPPLAVASVQEEPSCGFDGWSGSFSGTISYRGDDAARRQDRAGWQNGDRLIQRFVDDIRLCMRIHGDVVMSDDGRAVRAIGGDGWVVLESEDQGLRRLVITENEDGMAYAWSVDGRDRAFDEPAREWRDRMFSVLSAYWEASRLRGEQSSLRGRISSHRGHISSLRGRMSSARGHVSSLRGQMSSARGHISALNGRISSLRGHLSSLNGLISSHRGRISSLRSGLRDAESVDTRARLEEEIVAQEARIREVEREIEQFDIDQRVAEVQEEIAGYDLDERIRRIETEIDAYDLEGRLDRIEREIADYDLDGKVRELEAEIETLDADRRAAELERSVSSDLAALRRLIGGS